MNPTETYVLLLETLRESMRAQREMLQAIEELRDQVQALRENQAGDPSNATPAHRTMTAEPEFTPSDPSPEPTPVEPAPMDVDDQAVPASERSLEPSGHDAPASYVESPPAVRIGQAG